MFNYESFLSYKSKNYTFRMVKIKIFEIKSFYNMHRRDFFKKYNMAVKLKTAIFGKLF
jgi:hypothetical protein